MSNLKSDPAYYHLYFEPRTPANVIYRQPQTMENRYKIALLGGRAVGKSRLAEFLAGTSALPSQEGALMMWEVAVPHSLSLYTPAECPLIVQDDPMGDDPETERTFPTDQYLNQISNVFNITVHHAPTPVHMKTWNPQEPSQNGPSESGSDALHTQSDNVSVYRVHWQLPDKVWVKVDFVDFSDTDLCNPESLRALRPHLRDCSGVALVYDITDLRSFSQLEDIARSLKNVVPPDCDMIFVGNKSDCTSAPRQVPIKKADLLASNFASSLFECSALTGANARAAFEELVLKLRDKGHFWGNFGMGEGLEVDAVTSGEFEAKRAEPGLISRAFCAWRCF